MSRLISPSVLSANFGNLDADIEMINDSAADWIHLDIMDGVFVPNISFGFPVVERIKKKAEKPLDTHLMIVEPDRYIEKFKQLGADILTIHIEGSIHLHRTLQNIRSLGMKAGIALNPHTPVSMLEDIITEADLILIMSVNPGFGGQKFIPNSMEKIARTKELILRKNSPALIEVDGGVDTTNAQQLFDLGADALVAGNAVFGSANPKEAIIKLKSSIA